MRFSFGYKNYINVILITETKSHTFNKQPRKSYQIHSSFLDKIVYINHELTTMQLTKAYNCKYIWANA